MRCCSEAKGQSLCICCCLPACACPPACACLPAALLAAATEGCELEDCEEKAVVLFFVQEALANVTNAYLAFSTVSETVLYSEEDFTERAAVFAETLQEVADLNAGLTDFFVSVPANVACPACSPVCLPVCLPACLPVGLPGCLPVCLPSHLARFHRPCSSPSTSLPTSLRARGMA